MWTKRLTVSWVDQCDSECQMSKESGNITFWGWQRVVVPRYVQQLWAQQLPCRCARENGGNLALVLQANNWHLGRALFVQTPFRDRNDGKPVSSMLSTNCGGMLCSLTAVATRSRKAERISGKLSGTFFAAFVPLRHTKSIRRNRDSAQARPRTRLPPCSGRSAIVGPGQRQFPLG